MYIGTIVPLSVHPVYWGKLLGGERGVLSNCLGHTFLMDKSVMAFLVWLVIALLFSLLISN